MNKKLYRNEYNRVIGGVCSGLGEYFDIDVTIVRLLFCFAFFVMGVGLIPYIVLWIVLPKKGYLYNNFNNPYVDYRVPPQQPKADAPNTPPPSSPYGSNPFGGNPFQGNPFQYNTCTQPDQNIQPSRQNSHAGVIIGVVLMVLGGIILVNNYDLIPDFDFENLWPIMLVVVGLALIVSGQVRHSQRQSNIRNGNPAQPMADATDENSHQL